MILSLAVVSNANTLATYGFYALILGVVLQIVSYAIYGNKPYPNELSTTLPVSNRFEFSRRNKILAVVAVISVMAGIIGIQYFSSEIAIIGIPTTTAQLVITTTSGQSVITTTINLSRIYASEFFTRVFSEPQNETLVAFGVTAYGARSPYIFKAEWSDGFVQTNNLGTFSRIFQQGQSIPASVTVIVSSSNNQSTTLIIQIPVSSTTSSVATEKLQNFSDVTFVESGLASKLNWSVTMNGITESSESNTINYSELTNGNYSFNVAYNFDGNFSSAYKNVPASGSLALNDTNKIVSIVFSKISQSQVLTLAQQPSVSVANNAPIITFNYTNNLPAHLQCIVYALLNDSSGRLITSAITALIFNPDSTSTGQSTFTSIAPGNYSATILVESFGVVISQKTILKISIP